MYILRTYFKSILNIFAKPFYLVLQKVKNYYNYVLLLSSAQFCKLPITHAFQLSLIPWHPLLSVVLNFVSILFRKTSVIRIKPLLALHTLTS